MITCEHLLAAIEEILEARSSDLDSGIDWVTGQETDLFNRSYPRLTNAIDRAADLIYEHTSEISNEARPRRCTHVAHV